MKKNDIIAVTRYFKVLDKHGGFTNLENVYNKEKSSLNEEDIEMHSKVVSCDEYEKTEKVSKTELLDLLTNAGPLPFTVEFIKQDGSERTLRGTFVGLERHFGRSVVSDLDVGDIRQVDNRTIESLIINNIKYEVA